MRWGRVAAAAMMYLAAGGCGERRSASSPALTPSPRPSAPTAASSDARDVHSYGNPAEIRVRHADLDWDVLFDRKILRGTAVLSLERPGGGLAARVPVEEWVKKPGIPANAPRPRADVFARVDAEAKRWMERKAPASALDTRGWSTQEWLHFLRALPLQLERERTAELDSAFHFTSSGNSEITNQWLLMAIESRYELAYPKLEEFLTSMGRRKFLKPLYEALVKTPEGKARALAIYRKARPTYHPVATVDKIVGWGS